MRVIHLVRKPLEDASVAANVLRHGTGAVDIDGSRIAHTESVDFLSNRSGRWPPNLVIEHRDGCRKAGVGKVKATSRDSRGRDHSKYRFQGEGTTRSDVWEGLAGPDGMESFDVWDCEEGCPVAALDEQSGVLKSGAMDSIAKGGQYNAYGKMYERRVINPPSEGGASRFYKQVGGDDSA